MVKATDINDIMDEEEVIVSPEVEEEDDFFEDYFDSGDFGIEAVDKAAELAKIEGSFYRAKDWEKGKSHVVVPLTYRMLPEQWSREVMAELRNINPAQYREIGENLKVNMYGTLTIHKAEFDEADVKAFNKTLPEGHETL